MDDDKKEKNSPEYTESLNAVFFRSSIIDKIASKNRFVNRKEAAQIAFDMGQTKDHKKLLYSEDLY